MHIQRIIVLLKYLQIEITIFLNVVHNMFEYSVLVYDAAFFFL